MSLTMCRLSAKRLELLRDDPTLIRDVLRVSDQKVPGLLRVGKAWDALRHIVKPWDEGELLQSMLSATGGKTLANAGPFGKARVFDADAVKKALEVLQKIPSDALRGRVTALKGTGVQGEYFGPAAKPGSKDKEKEDEEEGESLLDALEEDDENDPTPELEATLKGVGELLREVSSKGESLLAIIT